MRNLHYKNIFPYTILVLQIMYANIFYSPEEAML